MRNDDVRKYVNNIEEKEGMSIEKFITVEKKSNNAKRDFLFVNKEQCKHIPCKASDMVAMCKTLGEGVASIIKERGSERCLVIGFAETATAIGQIVADTLQFDVKQCAVKYTVTTREDIQGTENLLTFEEEHSHATTQKMLCMSGDADSNISDYDTVVFVDDELTTGNTIINFIKALKAKSETEFKGNFVVASICNWQDTASKKRFEKHGIETVALFRGEIADVNAKVIGEYTENSGLMEYVPISSNVTYLDLRDEEYKAQMFETSRLVDDIIYKREYAEETCAKILDLLGADIRNNKYKYIRVIGTEEFMYVPITLALGLEKIVKDNVEVVCQATTRSSIAVSKEHSKFREYIVCKSKVSSVYSKDRNTYIYNLVHREQSSYAERKQELVLLVTDSCNEKQVRKLSEELNGLTNGKIYTILV